MSSSAVGSPSPADDRLVEADPETLAPALLAWYDQHGRRDLPWQLERTPYRVWVSEVMLQQTQVSTVLPYYERFIARFPDVDSLAAASPDEVLHLWGGLGYYARARNLHRAARMIMESYAGQLPTDLQELRSLPGIGRSTAGAILALSLSQRQPILDANARRVLARCFGVVGDAAQTRLWSLAEACTPVERVSDYTQAIMDLGSTVCVRSRPLCDSCPLAGSCIARLTGRQMELPSPRLVRFRPQRTAYAPAVLQRDRLLLEHRPDQGVWGGLWSLPQFETEAEVHEWLLTAWTQPPASTYCRRSTTPSPTSP
jgi:A/G-specific adenine glycosylase